MCEEYNGWTNRETWAVALWLDNDQGLHEMATDRVAEVWAPGREWLAADAVRDLADTLFTREGYVSEMGAESPNWLADAAADIANRVGAFMS